MRLTLPLLSVVTVLMIGCSDTLSQSDPPLAEPGDTSSPDLAELDMSRDDDAPDLDSEQDLDAPDLDSDTPDLAGEDMSPDHRFQEGIWRVRNVEIDGGFFNELDFEDTSGQITSRVFANANDGKKLDGFVEVLRHPNGYLIFTNPSDGMGSVVFFTNHDLEIQTEERLDKVSINPNKHAIIEGKIYYTNITLVEELNQPTNRVLVFDVESNKIDKEYDTLQVVQFLLSSEQELYFVDVSNTLYRVDDLDDLTSAKKVKELDDQVRGYFVIDSVDRIWGEYRSRHPRTLPEHNQSLRMGFDYQLRVYSYDMRHDKEAWFEGTRTIHTHSDFVADVNSDGVLMITNQNAALVDAPSRDLLRFTWAGDVLTRSVAHTLKQPKDQNSQWIDYQLMYGLEEDTLLCWGRMIWDRNRAFFYELDLQDGLESERVMDIEQISR